MTRKEALADLIAKVEAGEVVKSDLDAFIPVFGLTTDGNNALDAYRGSLDAAKALHEAVLDGWGYRIGECHLSDDAAVFPNFNCPVHGARLRSLLSETRDWFSETDVDQRPAGTPARAWLLSILRALHAMEAAE